MIKQVNKGVCKNYKRLVGLLLIISGLIMMIFGIATPYDPEEHFALDKLVEAFSLILPAVLIVTIGHVIYESGKVTALEQT